MEMMLLFETTGYGKRLSRPLDLMDKFKSVKMRRS